jgi:hypothetical protein
VKPQAGGIFLALIWLAAASGHCANEARMPEKGSVPPKPIEAVLEAHTAALMAVPGVVGVAQGGCKGSPCIKVFVEKDTPALRRQIPSTLESYPVEVEATGRFRALPK